MKSEKDSEEKESLKSSKGGQKSPKGRGRGKVVVNNPPEQKKRLGRPPKMKLAAIKLKRLDGEEISELVKEEKLNAGTRVNKFLFSSINKEIRFFAQLKKQCFYDNIILKKMKY